MTDITCVISINDCSIDVFLTNKIRSFHHIAAACFEESGYSDCHKMIPTFFRAYIKNLPRKNIEYRNLKNFYEQI